MRGYRTHVPVVRRPVPQPLSPEELARMHCDAVAERDERLLRVLAHVDLQTRVLRLQMTRAEDVGDPEEIARVAAAQELVAEDAPVHVRIEFTRDRVQCWTGVGFEGFLDVIRRWSPQEVAELAELAGARITVTYRGESESWETTLP